MKLAITALAAAAGLAGCADYRTQAAGASAYGAPAAEHAAGGRCFRTNDIHNHTIADDRTLYLGVGLHEVYRVTMSGGCLSAAWPSDPLVITTPGSTTLVCNGLDIDLAILRGGIQSHCLVDRITRLTPEQVAALPKKLRP